MLYFYDVRCWTAVNLTLKDKILSAVFAGLRECDIKTQTFEYLCNHVF